MLSPYLTLKMEAVCFSNINIFTAVRTSNVTSFYIEKTTSVGRQKPLPNRDIEKMAFSFYV
jgi:hypothetical protein